MSFLHVLRFTLNYKMLIHQKYIKTKFKKGGSLPRDYFEISPVSTKRNTTKTMAIGIINKATEVSNRLIFKFEVVMREFHY